MKTSTGLTMLAILLAVLFLGPWPMSVLSSLHGQGLTMDQIRSNLLSNPPGSGDPAVREASLLAFDALLVPDATPAAIQFYRDQVGKVAQELQADVPAGACVWMMYNHGFIVKTPGAVFAFDLISGRGGMTVVLPDDLVKRIDVFFVSHDHGDHYDGALASRVIANNGLVVGPSEMFGTGSGYVGMAAGQSRSLKNLQVTAHYGQHSVPVRMFEVTCPNGLKFLHTGDNQTSWNLPRVQGCVLLLNAWVNESGSSSAAVGMRNSLERVQPLLMIPGHIQELGHSYTPGDPTSRVIYAWAFEVDDEPTAAPMQVMTWGERYAFSVNSAQTPAELDIQLYAGLTITGAVGTVYSIEYVTDLAHTNNPSAWRCLEFLRLPASPYLWADRSAAATGRRFYRAAEFAAPTNMAFIPPGTFRMGSPEDEVDRYYWEGPQTAVTISRGYWLGKYEVTQGEYLAVMGSNPSYFTGNPNSPVETVSWYDATDYCTKLTQRERAAGRIATNCVYRLPTEAEWEYGCRAWTSTRFSYGDDPGYTELTKYAWYSDNSSGETHPVGQKLPNPWGLYDMHGNVWEWCQDWLDLYLGGIAVDPQGRSTGSARVTRGGNWT